VSPQFLVATAVRWLSLSAVAVLIGSLVLDRAVLPAAAPELTTARRRLRRWTVGSVVTIILTTGGELLVRTLVMTGGGVVSSFAAIPVVLTQTHFGTIWLARAAALAVVLVVSFSSSRVARTVALLLALGIAATTSLTGHAADRGDLSVRAFVDWGHVVATSAWAGGLLVLALAVLPARRAWPPELFATVVRRFSSLAGLCLLAVALSGAYNAWSQLEAPGDLWTTPYGRVLAAKILSVLALAWLGAINRYAVIPRLTRRRPPGIRARLFRALELVAVGRARLGRRALPARLSANVAREALLVVVVFACTAVLGESTPARHARHARHRVESDTQPAPFRVTMEELHRSGGVPAGWAFVPPRGDARRGRRLFVKLQCHTCHTVRGEASGPSSLPGPDLTDVGTHHPAAYLLQSIIDPDAVVVQGPGYTTSGGLSLMPPYGERLTVRELLDLVAYLRSLTGDDDDAAPNTPSQRR
jgi:putative copper export protein/mono/diheme cytochrome c family protein